MSNLPTKISRYFGVLRRTRFGLDLPFSGMINYLKHHFFTYREAITPKYGRPFLAQLVIINKCNLKCPFCILSIPKRQKDTLQVMTPEYVEQLLATDIMKGLIAVILSGGEPLLNKNICEIVQVVKKRKKQCAMITNGLLLPGKYQALLEAGLDEVQLSVYDHTLDQLEKIIPPINKQMTIHATYVLLRSVLEKDPERIRNVVRACRSMGFATFRFTLCQPFDNNISETIFEDNEAYRQLQKELKKEHIGYNLFISDACKRSLRGAKDKKCRIPWQQIHVLYNGKMTMCCGFNGYNSEDGILFDGQEVSCNRPELRLLRKKLLEDSSNICNECRYCVHLAGSFSSSL